MKKTSLLVTLPALVVAGLLLSGCGAFRSHKAWKTAQQESPLEIPPGMDRPSTSEALVIPPPGANQPTANGATASVGTAAAGQIADGFVLSDSVDSAYQRVGQVLGEGNLGQLVGHDDATHVYTLSVPAAVAQQKKGFFKRMFSRGDKGSAAPGAASQQVQVSITDNGGAASNVRAEGQAAAVAKVIDTLKSRLGN